MNMTASMFSEKGYILETETVNNTSWGYGLKEMRVYHYGNVWETRNAYEKFFLASEGLRKYDNKRIIMMGDEELMVLTQIYIYECLSMENVNNLKKEIFEEYKEKIYKDAFMRNEIKKMEKKIGRSSFIKLEKERIMNMSLEELGMTSRNIVGLNRRGIKTVGQFVAYLNHTKKLEETGGHVVRWLGNSTLIEFSDA